MKNSANSRSSSPRAVVTGRFQGLRVFPGRVPELWFPFVAATIASLSAIWFFWQRGDLYLYGDAEAHLNIARRLFDNREPAYREIGTVWLPLPHLLLAPFAAIDRLWINGLAAAVPSSLCMIAAVVMFYAALRKLTLATSAVWTGALVLLLNPNLLYLQTTAMTEPVMAAALAGIFWSTVSYARSGAAQGGRRKWLWLAAAFSCAASLTRYEGWFLIPFVTLFFWKEGGLFEAMRFGTAASIAPVYWVAHNWWLYGDAMYFYSGPWSAKAIYARQLAQGMGRYPADGNPSMALLYYRTAVELVNGQLLLWIGLVGMAVAVALRRWWWAVTLLLASPAFYLWSLYSSGTPIFVPTLWPHSYYNSRYALAALPAIALGAAAIVATLQPPFRRVAVLVTLFGIGAHWKTVKNPDQWLVWKEARHNSETRFDWTEQAASFFRANYTPGDGILYSFGDQTGILRSAGIPLRETLHDGNEFQFLRTLNRPDLFLRERWVVAFKGDAIERSVAFVNRKSAKYVLVHRIIEGSTTVEIYRRMPDR